MWLNPQFPVDLVIFTEKILNGKLHFLCSAANLRNTRKSREICSKLTIKTPEQRLKMKVIVNK